MYLKLNSIRSGIRLMTLIDSEARDSDENPRICIPRHCRGRMKWLEAFYLHELKHTQGRPSMRRTGTRPGLHDWKHKVLQVEDEDLLVSFLAVRSSTAESTVLRTWS